MTAHYHAEQSVKLCHKAEARTPYQKENVDAALASAHASLAVYYKLIEIQATIEALLDAVEDDEGPPGPPWWRRIFP